MYTPYEKYKDSGVKWIGEVPEHWEINKVKRTTYVKGRIGWQGLRADEFIDQGPYLVTGTDFIKGVIKWETCYHISHERFNEAPEIQLKEDDLLITKDGSIGKVALVKDKPDKAILNSGIFVTRPRSNLYSQKFMFWILNSNIFYEFIKYMELGSTIKHLYQATFERMPFFLPKKDGQKSIVKFLDHKTSEIDSLIADKEELIKKLEEYKQAIITEAVTKGFNPDVKMKDSGIEWVGEIPEHWEVMKLRRCISKFVDYRGKTPTKTVSGVPLITAKNIKNGTIDHSIFPEYIDDETYEKHMVRGFPQKGDVVITTEAPLGEVAQIDDEMIALAQRVILFKVDENDITNEYLYYYFLSDAGKNELLSRSTGSTALGIKASKLKGITCILPPIEEQIKISRLLDYKIIEINDVIALIDYHLQKLKSYRQSLIFEAVTGKIDVRDYQLERSEQFA